MILCPDMSSKLRFQVHYGDGYISHDAYGVDLSAFERRELLALLKYPFYPLFILDNGINLISKSLTVLTPA